MKLVKKSAVAVLCGGLFCGVMSASAAVAPGKALQKFQVAVQQAKNQAAAQKGMPMPTQSAIVKKPIVVGQSSGTNTNSSTSTTVKAKKIESWTHEDLDTAHSQGYKGKGANIKMVGWDNTSDVSAMNFVKKIAPDAIYQQVDLWPGKPKGNFNGWAASGNIIVYPYATYYQGEGDSINAGILSRAKSQSDLVIKAVSPKVGGIIAGNALVVNGTNYADTMAQSLSSGNVIYAIAKTSAQGSTTASNPNGTTVVLQSSVVTQTGCASAPYTAKCLAVPVGSTGSGFPDNVNASLILGGYAAILKSKFTSATASQISNQLLSTATPLSGSAAAQYGNKEVNLGRALKPASLN